MLSCFLLLGVEWNYLAVFITACTTEKFSIYHFPFQMAFFVHILLIYQISTYAGLYTRSFDFSHFCDFQIPFVNHNSHILNHTPEFLTYTCCISIWENFLFCFCHGKTFSLRYLLFFLDTYQDILSMWSLILNQCVWKYAKNIFCKTLIYIISTCSLSYKLYILYIYGILLVMCLEVNLHKKLQ